MPSGAKLPAAGEQCLQQALHAHQNGRLDAALRGYLAVLEHSPSHATALANLASIHTRQSRFQEALACYQKALQSGDTTPELWFNHGNLQRRLGQGAEAAQSYARALQLNPRLYPAHCNLARLLLAQNRQAEATTALAAALTRFPEAPELLRLYGDALYHQDDAAAALAVYQKLAALQPDQASTYNALGVAYRASGQLQNAEAAWQRCLVIDAGHVVALTNLGTLYRLQKRHEAALVPLRKAVALQPGDPDCVASLACTLIDIGQISAALALTEPALALRPEHADLLGMHAFALVQQARIAEGQACLAKARRLKPANPVAIGNSLFSSLYSDQLDAPALTRLHQALADSLTDYPHPVSVQEPVGSAAATFKAGDKARPFAQRRVQRQQRPLRIGYLSPDFRAHPIGFFIEPVLQQHDRDRFHVTCYALPHAADSHSERLKSHGHRWRDFEGCNLRRMGETIRQDGIDILVDLAGHTAGGRMDLMACKPAPIQALFLGYPYTSGLAAMDYLIADRHLIPAPLEPLYRERVACLAHSFLCYQAQPGTPEVAALPALTHGHITFGSFNNLPKLSASCLDLWAGVLSAVPDSRLALMASSLADAGTRQRFRRHFIERGITGERIDLLPPVTPLTRFLAEYGRIDIALDPMPFNGGTTTCDALWMGVPVVTLAGQGFMSRMGVSLLNTLQRPEWIAADADGYVGIAAALAADIPRLQHIRSTLRAQMAQSGLCDAAGYTTGLERIYLEMMRI